MRSLGKYAPFIFAATLLASAPAARSQSAPPAPAVADIMGATQLRHFKLWFAGSLGNWPLAAYEVEQIKRSFDDAGKVGAPVGGEQFAHLIDRESLPPLAAIEAAIKGKGSAAFDKAFEKLTAACNACHATAGVGFIRMQTPTASPFSNQAFPPQ